MLSGVDWSPLHSLGHVIIYPKNVFFFPNISIGLICKFKAKFRNLPEDVDTTTITAVMSGNVSNYAATNVMPEGEGPQDRVGILIRNKNLESNFPTLGSRFQFKVPHLGKRF